MLELLNVTKSYAGEKKPVLDNMSITINQGEFVAVLGLSGAGKSTLIRCINRLIEIDAGDIRVGGDAVTRLKGRKLRRYRSEIGMIFQHYNLLPRLTVMTNVLSGTFGRMPKLRSLLGLFTKLEREAALAALREVKLEELAGRRVEQLSGGQKQRVAIARMLMQKPRLLLGDEPVSSLDPVTARRVLSYIAKLHREHGLTVILNLHNVELAKAFAGRIIGLAEGRIVFDGAPDELGEQELLRVYPPDDDQLPV